MPSKPRKPLLDAMKRSDICATLAVGGTRRLAARYVGCSPSTIVRTAHRDPSFAEQLRRACSKHEIIHLKNIDAAAQSKQYWRASTWALERKYPKRYAARPPDTITVDQIGQLMAKFAEIIIEEVPQADDRQRVLSRLEQLTASVKATSTSRRKKR